MTSLPAATKSYSRATRATETPGTEAGRHQNWTRDYDPTTGRYIQADPLGLVDWASVYGYALQIPGWYTDPTGEFVPLAWYGMSFAFGYSMGQEIQIWGSNWRYWNLLNIAASTAAGGAGGGFGGNIAKGTIPRGSTTVSVLVRNGNLVKRRAMRRTGDLGDVLKLNNAFLVKHQSRT